LKGRLLFIEALTVNHWKRHIINNITNNNTTQWEVILILSENIMICFYLFCFFTIRFLNDRAEILEWFRLGIDFPIRWSECWTFYFDLQLWCKSDHQIKVIFKRYFNFEFLGEFIFEYRYCLNSVSLSLNFLEWNYLELMKSIAKWSASSSQVHLNI